MIAWSGMRGGVSLAAALAITHEGFPDRDLVIFVAYAVIVLTLVLPGLTLAPLVRRLGLRRERGAQARGRRGAAADHAGRARAPRRARRRRARPRRRAAARPLRLARRAPRGAHGGRPRRARADRRRPGGPADGGDDRRRARRAEEDARPSARSTPRRCARSSASWTSMRAASARESGSDTMEGVLAAILESGDPNASTPGCRCSSPPPRRARRRAALLGLRRAARAAATRTWPRGRRTSSRPSASRSRARSPSCARVAGRAAQLPPLGLRRRGAGDRRGRLRGRDLDAGVPARGRRRAAGVRVKRALALCARCCSPAAAAPPAISSRSSAPAPTAPPTSRWSSPTTAPSPATGRRRR